MSETGTMPPPRQPMTKEEPHKHAYIVEELLRLRNTIGRLERVVSKIDQSPIHETDEPSLSTEVSLSYFLGEAPKMVSGMTDVLNRNIDLMEDLLFRANGK